MVEPDGTPFANVVWHALTGPQRTVAEHHRTEIGGTAVRLDPRVGPFSAVPDVPTPDDWDALRALIGPGRAALLFRDRVRAPEGWGVEMRTPCLQMVTERVDTTHALEPSVLGPDDVDEMLDLVRRTEPGPFARRTIELGTYLGVRDEGTLVAIAGERFHLGDWQEVSAVCTDPAHRGRGFAAGLVRAVVAGIHERGERAFLQVRDDNISAIGLYDALGFTVCGTAEAVAVRAPA